MAFLPAAAAAAGTAGTAAAATGAGAALGSGLAAGSMLGSGLTASAGLLAPTLGASLGATGAGLGSLAGLSGAGLTAAGGALAPTLGASLGTAGGLGAAGLGGVGLKAGAGMLAPGLGSALPAASTTLPAIAATNPVLSQAAQTSKFGLDALSMPGTGVKMPEALYGGMSTPEMGFGTMGQGAAGVVPPATAVQPQFALSSGIKPGADFATNAMNLIQNPSMQGLKDYAQEHPYVTSAAVGLGTKALLGGDKKKPPEQDKGMIRPYEFMSRQRPEAYAVSPLQDTSERLYFDNQFIAQEPYPADSDKAKVKKAEGGIAQAYAVGGPVETMAALNSVGANTGYPMAGISTPMYANPMVQRPEATNVIAPTADAGVGAYTGEPRFAGGGLSDLGGYSDGGRLLKGPGDGVSDSIPAVIGKRQPARLADGEFVIPARIVSELGNGSTDAGARKLYKMMERIQKGRSKSVGKDKVAVDSKADKHLPA